MINSNRSSKTGVFPIYFRETCLRGDNKNFLSIDRLQSPQLVVPYNYRSFDMSRVQKKTRVSARLSHTLKQHYGGSDGSDRSFRKPNIDSDDDAMGVDSITWKLTMNTMDRFAISTDNENFVRDYRTFRFGRNNEEFYLDENTLVFRGSAITRAKMQFMLPDGRLSIAWYGGQLIIDETYSLVKKNMTLWHQLPREMGTLHATRIYVRGERADPITLSHAHRSYIIRLNESYPAVVMPRCAYYPLKLALMKDLVAQMGPIEVGACTPLSPVQPRDDTRVPSPAPCTPPSAGSSQSPISNHTPPTQYVRSQGEDEGDEIISESE